MSMVQQLSHIRTTEGSAARQLPSTERAPRPERKSAIRQQRRRLFVACGLGWVLIMATSLVLIHRNGLVAAETAAITRGREELALLERSNQELEARLVQANSVAAVERWAAARGMRHPVAIKSLKGDPTAVAVRPAPPSASVEAAKSDPGWWWTVKDYLARMGSSVNLVGSPR